ncbi:MAG: hypothetical protein AAF558_12545, partial [Verrucomicrobiota bacterium]
MNSYELWERLFPEEKHWLGFIVFVSFCFHVAAFFFFKIEMLPDVKVTRRPPSITVIGGSSRSAFLDASSPMTWIKWRDPTAIALPNAPLPEPPKMEDETDLAPRRAL